MNDLSKATFPGDTVPEMGREFHEYEILEELGQVCPQSREEHSAGDYVLRSGWAEHSAACLFSECSTAKGLEDPEDPDIPQLPFFLWEFCLNATKSHAPPRIHTGGFGGQKEFILPGFCLKYILPSEEAAISSEYISSLSLFDSDWHSLISPVIVQHHRIIHQQCSTRTVCTSTLTWCLHHSPVAGVHVTKSILSLVFSSAVSLSISVSRGLVDEGLVELICKNDKQASSAPEVTENFRGGSDSHYWKPLCLPAWQVRLIMQLPIA